MLTDLAWIANGKPWPPTDGDEKVRLAEHAKMRAIYNGLHESIFPRYIAYLADSSADSKKQAVILDWPELATGTTLNLLLGEEPEVTAGSRDDLPERPDEQVFIDVSRYGLGLYEISDLGIQALNPESCYIVVTPGNIQLPSAFVFFAIWKQVEKEGGKDVEKEYIKFTIHSKSKIQHVVYELVIDGTNLTVTGIPGITFNSGKHLSGPKALKDFPAYSSLLTEADGSQAPPVDDMLIVCVQNQLSSERYYGKTDYKPSVVSLVESLELSFAQRDEVLAKFTSPTPVVPESATTFDHKSQEWVYKSGKPIITQPGDIPPELLVWQAELGAVENAIEQKMDQLLQMLQLSRVLLAGKDAGTAESGTALRIRLIPTLAKVSRYARAAEHAIPKVINLWSQLHQPVIDIKEITVNLQDGIPEDPLETAQTAEFWDRMGAISLERKLVLQGLKEGSGAFDEELERLKGAQEEAKQAMPGAPRVELPPMNEEEQNAEQQPAQ